MLLHDSLDVQPTITDLHSLPGNAIVAEKCPLHSKIILLETLMIIYATHADKDSSEYGNGNFGEK